MPARAYWQGQIRLALVSIPVEIFTATKSGRSIAFRQIHEPSGQPIRYEKVVPGIGPVDTDEILKGFEYERGNYVLLDDADIEAVRLESKRTLDLTQFVDVHEIDPLYFEKPYYVVPADKLAEEAFIVLRDALRRSHKIALGQLALRGREYIVALKPCGRGMSLETLRYADEVKKAASFFRDIPDLKPDEELLELAESLIEKKSAPFDPDMFRDRYVDALRELIDSKMTEKGGKVTPAEEKPEALRASNVIDLMAALKESVDRQGAPAKRGGKRGETKSASANVSKPRKHA